MSLFHRLHPSTPFHTDSMNIGNWKNNSLQHHQLDQPSQHDRQLEKLPSHISDSIREHFNEQFIRNGHLNDYSLVPVHRINHLSLQIKRQRQVLHPLNNQPQLPLQTQVQEQTQELQEQEQEPPPPQRQRQPLQQSPQSQSQEQLQTQESQEQAQESQSQQAQESQSQQAQEQAPQQHQIISGQQIVNSHCNVRKSTSTNLEVFLGGSCNPTTWREEIAIPLLEKGNISYYNPQVGEWSEDLIQLETNAKEECQILLFVIDNQTRSLVSLNEAAEYICRGKHVVLVLQGIHEGTLIGGVPLCKTECDDLNRSRQHLIELAKRHTVQCFSDIKTAIDSIVDSIKCFRSFSTSQLHLNSSNENKSRTIAIMSNGGCFCHPIHEGLLKSYNQRYCTCSIPLKSALYLGGSHNGSKWRDEIAIPLLEEKQIPYYSNLLEDNDEVMALGKECSNRLFIVIDKQTRSLSEMTDAIELMCSKRKIVLVVEDVVQGVMIDGEVITGRELLDLNRARCYLRESCTRHNIACFDTVQDGLKCILQMNENDTLNS